MSHSLLNVFLYPNKCVVDNVNLVSRHVNFGNRPNAIGIRLNLGIKLFAFAAFLVNVFSQKHCAGDSAVSKPLRYDKPRTAPFMYFIQIFQRYRIAILHSFVQRVEVYEGYYFISRFGRGKVFHYQLNHSVAIISVLAYNHCNCPVMILHLRKRIANQIYRVHGYINI